VVHAEHPAKRRDDEKQIALDANVAGYWAIIFRYDGVTSPLLTTQRLHNVDDA
jgi:hypothetical protein